jgi:hypothetical protein
VQRPTEQQDTGSSDPAPRDTHRCARQLRLQRGSTSKTAIVNTVNTAGMIPSRIRTLVPSSRIVAPSTQPWADRHSRDDPTPVPWPDVRQLPDRGDNDRPDARSAIE